MIRVEELSSGGILYIESKDFEIVKVSSERNLLHNFKTLTFNYAFNLETQVREVLSKNFKLIPQYKILVVGDEKLDSLEIKKAIILLEDEEKKQCVMNSLTGKFFEFGIMEEKVEDKKITLFYQNCSKWCDSVQNYLANSFNFDGFTKITASAYNGDLVSFDITVSGKGTNDNIVFATKQISKAMNDISLTLSEDEIYTFVDNYFN